MLAGFEKRLRKGWLVVVSSSVAATAMVSLHPLDRGTFHPAFAFPRKASKRNREGAENSYSIAVSNLDMEP